MEELIAYLEEECIDVEQIDNRCHFEYLYEGFDQDRVGRLADSTAIPHLRSTVDIISLMERKRRVLASGSGVRFGALIRNPVPLTVIELTPGEPPNWYRVPTEEPLSPTLNQPPANSIAGQPPVNTVAEQHPVVFLDRPRRD